MERLPARFSAAALVRALGTILLITSCSCTGYTQLSNGYYDPPPPRHRAPAEPPTAATPVASVPVAGPEDVLDQEITSLAEGIRRFATGTHRVAVMPMQRLNGGVPELGRFLADKLTNRLFAEGQGFAVVDRFHLEDAMREIHLGYTFVQDPQSAQKIGRVLGADAIVVGSLTKLDRSIDVSLRLLQTETLDVLGTAEARLPTNLMVMRLWSTDARTEAPPLEGSAPPLGGEARPSSDSGSLSCGTTPPPGCFYFEDFSTVAKGEIPAGWTGGDGMVVKAGASGNPELVSVETQTPFFVQTCALSGFSGDFDLEIKAWWDGGSLGIKLGGLMVHLSETGEVAVGTTVGGVSRRLENSLHTILIQRRGQVVVVLVDGDEAVVARPGRMSFSPGRIIFTTAELDLPASRFGVAGIQACRPQP